MSLSSQSRPNHRLPPNQLRLTQVVFIILSTFAIQAVIAYFVFRLSGVERSNIDQHPGILAQITLFPSLAAIAWIWFNAVWREPNGFNNIGLIRPQGRWIRLSIMVAIIGFTLNVIFGNLMANLMGEPPTAAIPANVFKEASMLSLFALFFAISVAAPIYEEFLFRGVFFGYLKEKLSILNAAAIAAVIHAAFHGSIATLPGLFIVFVLFAYLYRRTGTIWAPCLAHGIHNFIVMCIAYGHSVA